MLENFRRLRYVNFDSNRYLTKDSFVELKRYEDNHPRPEYQVIYPQLDLFGQE